MLVVLLFLIAGVSAFFGDFFNQHQNFQQQQAQPQTPEQVEQSVLNNGCKEYLCPDTLSCVRTPNDCPCKFPSSQLRCVLPDGSFMCISKPAGDISEKYNDPSNNWKIDAGGDVRDCGWVSRAWNGLV
ncbi:long chronological lifespan protein 2 [[Candida] anglica]|uniref:Long chronological lifespan protein 2 n=1 Tax=[Candida] anglica TaxID=148631 RepID=A0ABP0EDF3_9ASCO